MQISKLTPSALGTCALVAMLAGCNNAGSKVAPSVPQQTSVKLASGAPDATARKRSQNAPRYVLVDLGTFGGPTSFINANLGIYNCCNGAGLTPALTEGGAITGGADTAIANPYPYANQNPEACCDAYVNQTFEWKGNALRNLGTLPHGSNSFAYALNASGTAVGVSDFGVIDPFGGYPEQLGHRQ
jgi:hypothetical protein